ncbi:MAG: hypothetical protein EOO16_01255 [Chitinophagaceae bacterium]|nr:MAG: hypothetical protein EOO16_01255 [Chitinophagaceae bacterium]
MMALKKRFAALASAAFLLLLVISCQKEISLEGSGLLPSVNDPRCINCTYLPFCDSSEFTYLVDGTDTLGGAVRLLGDTTIGGQRFSKVGGYAVFDGGLYYNCANAEYRGAFPLAQFGIDADSLRALLQPALDSLLPIPGSTPALAFPDPFYTTILKANAPAGSTWTDTVLTVNLPVGQPPAVFNVRLFAGVQYTYPEKDITRSVLGRSYANVQHVQGKLTIGTAAQIPVPLPLPAPTNTVDIYFAKDIGVVEIRIADAGVESSRAELLRYRL